MYAYELLVEVDALDIENVALFGFKLARFSQSHPDVKFRWREADYEHNDNKGGSVIFQIDFMTEEGCDRYLSHRIQCV